VEFFRHDYRSVIIIVCINFVVDVNLFLNAMR
jgi:hypothetical protein